MPSMNVQWQAHTIKKISLVFFAFWRFSER